MEDHCPGILSCLSKGRKSMKLPISTGKKVHLFHKAPPSGCFFAKFIQTQKKCPTSLDNISILNNIKYFISLTVIHLSRLGQSLKIYQKHLT